MFNPNHAVRVRPPYEVKRFGHPDKPYVIEWSYPLMYNGRCIDTRRRHKLATADKTFEFALKHRIPSSRLPYAIRKKLCEHAQTVRARTSTSTAPCARSSAANADGGCRGS